jgi:hypothetical protein
VSQLVVQPSATLGKDTYIQVTGGPTGGTGAVMSCGLAAGKVNNAWRALIEFDISGIPAGEIVVPTSKLTLNITTADGGRAGQTLDLVSERWGPASNTDNGYPTDGSGTAPGGAGTGWNESKVTWSDYDSDGGVHAYLWSASGVPVRGITPVAFNAPSATGAFDIGAGDSNFAALLEYARTNMGGRFFVMLKGPEINGIGDNYWQMSTSDDATAGNRPKLTVDYGPRRRFGAVV